MHYRRFSAGLTIVEVVVGVAVSSILVIAFMTLLTHFFQVASANMATSKQVAEAQAAINMIDNDLRIAKVFLDHSDFVEPTDPGHAPVPSDGLWKFNSTPNTLILRLPATTHAYQNPDRMLVYDANSGDCESGGVSPVFTNVVYYVEESTLYRRIITGADISTCGGVEIAQVPTCKSGCNQTDVTVLHDLEDFSVEYYSRAHDADPNPDAYDIAPGTNLIAQHRAARINITTTKNINDEPHEYTIYSRGALVW